MEQKAPLTLKAGAGSLVIYGLLVFGQALLFGAASEWSDRQGLIRAAVRCIGVTFVSLHLLKLHRWAWYLGLLGSASLLVLSGLAMPFVISVARAGELPLGRLSLVFASTSVLALMTSFLLLLAPASRRAVFGKG